MENRHITADARQLGDAISQTLSQGGNFVLTVTGTSMRPTLTPLKDRVQLAAPRRLKVGDIVFFRRVTGDYVLHRLLRLEGERLTVNGDSQTWTETVQISQVTGVVKRVFRGGKWIDADSLSQRVYSRLWPLTRPVRPALIRMKSKIRKT